MTRVKKIIGWCVLALLIVLVPVLSSVMVYSAIMSQSGLAVAQSSTAWNPLKDIIVGDGQTSGVGLFSPCLWNGTSCDRARGDTVNGQQVNVTKLPASIGDSPVQSGTLLNSRTVSATNTATTLTLTGAASQRIHLYKIQARCSAGSSFLTVQDGATTIYETDGGTIPSGTQYANYTWLPGLTATTGNNMVITVAACGAGNISVLTVQADQF